MSSTFNVKHSTIVINNISDSFNNNSNCEFNNNFAPKDSSGSNNTAVKVRKNVSNEEFCSVWATHHSEGLGKISCVLNVSPKWAWTRYLCLTNTYNNVQLPLCRDGYPEPVDAESLNAIVATTMYGA